jgi:hypothetical protein
MVPTKYLTYTPWQGQLNNTRMCFETALVFAWLSRRCLVMPAAYRRAHEPEVQAGCFRPLDPAECFALEKLHDSLETVSREEYERAIGSCGDLSNQVDLILPPETSVFCYPNIPDPGSAEAARLRDFAVHRTRFLEFTPEMEACRTLNLKGGVLELFYAFFFFTQPAVDAQCKRLIKDHVRFRAPVAEAAGRIAQSLGDYQALHVRRNDFFRLYPQQDIPGNRLLGNVMMRIPTGARLFIASDEPDRTFFADVANYYDVRFIEDFRSFLPAESSAAFLACVEQMVCALAGKFMGTRLSTFSAYITRLRGYLGASDLSISFTDGCAGSEMDDEGSPPFSWINWVRSGYPIWGREFREGWNV